MPENGLGGRPAWWMRAAPALTFLVGLALGGLVVGVAANSSNQAGESKSQTAQTPSADAGSPDVTVTVPGACQDAAALVQQAVVLLRQGAADVRDFQPNDLVEMLDKLETIDAELRAVSPKCSAIGVEPGG